MAWKKMAVRSRVASDEPYMSVQKGGKLSWNEATQNLLGQPGFVEVLWDQANGHLGVRPADGQASNVARVIKHTSQNTWTASAMGALRQMGLMVSQAQRYRCQQEGDVVFIVVGE